MIEGDAVDGNLLSLNRYFDAIALTRTIIGFDADFRRTNGFALDFHVIALAAFYLSDFAIIR